MLRKELRNLNTNLTDLIDMIKDYSKIIFSKSYYLDLKKKPHKE